MSTRLLKRLRIFRRDERGSPTVEFVILFPIYIFLFCSAFEVGLLFIKKVMLDRGLDLTARILKVGNYPGAWGDTPEFDEVKDAICDFTPIVANCDTVLNLELYEIGDLRLASTSDFTSFATSTACIDRQPDEDIVPLQKFTAGARGNVMLMRACVIVDPFFNNAGIAQYLSGIRDKGGEGGFYLISRSAFTNEP